MRRLHSFFLLAFFVFRLSAQDTTEARRIIKFLTSKKCYGRGYLNDGLQTAAKYLAAGLKKNGAEPLFTDSYFQPFTFNVNTFPGKVKMKVDGKKLKPGIDFILLPESGSAKGTFTLRRKDSAAFVSEGPHALVVSLHKKLAFSVGHEVAPYCQIQLLNQPAYENIQSVNVDVENRFEKEFPNNNVCAYLPGLVDNDSMVIFSAHYDHLGGMGKKTYFPGANDNASGVSMVMNLVKYYKAHPPKYKTLFLFFAGEEAGLIGSKFFTKSQAVDLKKIKFLINLDLLGTGDDGIMVVNGAIHEKEFEVLNTINAEKKLVKDIRKRGKAKNSDHYWFTEAGVPAFFIYTLGGKTTYYHDVMDKAETLPLTDYMDVMTLIELFVEKL